MVALNKIMVIGNVGADPEMRYTPSGNPMTSFSIATNRSYNAPDGERRRETEWFRVVAWGNLAEVVNNYLKKGQRAYVEGRLHLNSFRGNDGQMRFNNEITANQVLFLDRPATAEGGPAFEDYSAGAGGSGFDASDAPSPDDLPF